MRVDQSRERRVAETLPGRQQRESQGCVARVAGVDQDVAVAALEQHLVRREPVANEDMDLRREMGGGGGHVRTRDVWIEPEKAS